MIDAILVACGGSIIAACVSLISLFLNRKWQNADKADALLRKLNEIESKLNSHIEADKMSKAMQARQRILRFADECGRGEKHSQEFFESVLADIDFYEEFCKNNTKTFANSKAVMSIKLIRSIYEDCLKEHKFI